MAPPVPVIDDSKHRGDGTVNPFWQERLHVAGATRLEAACGESCGGGRRWGYLRSKGIVSADASDCGAEVEGSVGFAC